MLESYISERFPEVTFDSVTDKVVSFVDFGGFSKGLNLLGLNKPYESHAIRLPYKPYISWAAIVKYVPEDKDIIILASNFIVVYGEHRATMARPDEAEDMLNKYKLIADAY